MGSTNPIEERFRISTADLCDALGVTAPTIGNWNRHHGFPRPEVRGWYSIQTVMGWLVEAWQEARRPVGGADAEARLTAAKAGREELKLENERGDLVERVLVEHAVDGAVVEARGIFENIVPMVMSVVPVESREEVEPMLRRQVDRSLMALSRGKDLREEEL